MAPPQVWVNRTPCSCGKVVKKCSEQPGERLGVAVEPVGHLVAEVVDRVVAAPQDAVVRCEPVVVELVARVGDALAALPADRRELVGGQRLGDQRVVADRDDVGAQPAEQGGEGVGAEGDVAGGTTPYAVCSPSPDPVSSTESTAEFSKIRTPTRRQACLRPPASRAGSTIATPERSSRPPR